MKDTLATIFHALEEAHTKLSQVVVKGNPSDLPATMPKLEQFKVLHSTVALPGGYILIKW